ncbi:hypothetical protein BFV94_4566 [Alteromonas macleodii]|nr:hypothetical protein BFV94_4566 [Alteromonas macleodii]OES39138.1 hypothetical protein BFV96_4286 [Alteromonas macleodii]
MRNSGNWIVGVHRYFLACASRMVDRGFRIDACSILVI